MINYDKMGVILKNLFLLVLFLFLVFPFVYANPSGFTIVELNENLNQLHIKSLILSPEPLLKNCTLQDEKQLCEEFFYFKSQGWSEFKPNQIKLNSQRFYPLLHPETTIVEVENCSDLATGFGADVGITLQAKSKITLKSGEVDTVTVDFSKTNNIYSPCIKMDFLMLNPSLVNVSKQKFYPLDSYELFFGIFSPKINFWMNEVRLPKQFSIDKMESAPEEFTQTSSGNIGFFVHKDIPKSKSIDVHIIFSRYPSYSKLFYGVLLVVLPLILIFYFLFSKNPEALSSKEHTVTAFYIILLPLFFLLKELFNDKPNVFTLLDFSFLLSLFMLFFCFLKDFTPIKFEEFKVLNRYSFRGGIIFLLILVLYFIWI